MGEGERKTKEAVRLYVDRRAKRVVPIAFGLGTCKGPLLFP